MPCPHLIDNCCDVQREELGWRVGVSEGVCQRCEAEGGDPRKRKDIERRVIGSLKARVIDANMPVWEKHTGVTGPEASIHKLAEKTGWRLEEIVPVLDEAVERGLDPIKAAELAEAVERGPDPVKILKQPI